MSCVIESIRLLLPVCLNLRAVLTPEDATRRNARLITFFHRTNYGKFEPLNNAIMNFNYNNCDLFGLSGAFISYAYQRPSPGALMRYVFRRPTVSQEIPQIFRENAIYTKENALQKF
jgi:hypothetical protein